MFNGKTLVLGCALIATGSALASTGKISNDRLLTDGKLVPNAVYRWTSKPIEVVTDFGEEREIGGVRIMSGRSWVNCCVRKASFYDANGCPRVRLTDGVERHPPGEGARPGSA